MTRPDPRPIFLDENGRYVFEDGTPVPEQPIGVRKALVGGVVTFALVIVIPLLVGFAGYRHVTSGQIKSNETLVRRLNAERIARTQVINEFIYEQCVAGEVRDIVIVEQLRAAKRRVRSTLPVGSVLREQQLESLDDGINALEPENERDCTPPPAVKPKGLP